MGSPYILPIEVIVETMREVFARGGAYDLTVTGSSMSPTLQPGRDAVRLISARSEKIRKGDILFAKRASGGYMLHRVVKVLPDGGCTLNGDGQEWVEDVAAEDILGVVTAIRQKGRWIPAGNGLYRMYVWVWGFTRPFRDGLVRIKKKLTGYRRNGK